MKRTRMVLSLVLLIAMISALAVSVNAKYIRRYETSTVEDNDTLVVMASMQGHTLLEDTKFYDSYATLRFDPILENAVPDYLTLEMSIYILAYGGVTFNHTTSGTVDIGGYIFCQNAIDYLPEENITYLKGTYFAWDNETHEFINPPEITISGYMTDI